MSAAPGQVLNGRYRLDSVLGEGGMAVVWRARDLLLDRDVAVKILREQYAADPEFLERFHTEARSAAALNDPGVVAVYDVGEADGLHYLVMEIVPGRDLKALIREEAPLVPQRAVAIATALARSVSAAHRLGLVHRDLKPQNVLVAPDGRMKVTDFGIARSVSAARLTTPGFVLGTVHYLSPEQVDGQPATPASDVYSLGVVLYEMLSGRVPFEAESEMGVAMRILRDEPIPLTTLNPSVPPALAAIVARAMARRPEERYPDAGALADALTHYATSAAAVTGPVPVVPSADGLPPRPAPSAARQPSPSGFGWTGVVLALITLAAVGGLIPLWLAVLARVEAMPALPLLPDRSPASTQPLPNPTADQTAAVRELLVTVPAVEGLPADEARNRIVELGLAVTDPREPSDQVPAGRVIRQQPRPGEQVPRGTVVEITVSQGPAVRVPTLGGDYATAAAQLLALGFEPVRRDQWTGAAGAPGRVLGTDPPGGTIWPVGSPVQVNVDSGSWLPIGADFEGGLHLRGIDLPRAEVAPGDVLGIGCTWEATTAVDTDYGVSVILTSADGGELARVDGTPGDRPTSTWLPGERFTSARFDLPIGAETTRGDGYLWLEVWPLDNRDAPLAVRSRGLARSTRGPRLLLAIIRVG